MERESEGAGNSGWESAEALVAQIEQLKADSAAEPWLFAKHAAVEGATGQTGLPNAGAASAEGKTMKRWRDIAGLSDDEAE